MGYTEYVEPIQEVLTETPSPNLFGQRPICRGDDASLELAQGRRAERTVFVSF